MYYKLNENLVLRGWEKLPYAVQELRTGRTQFLDECGFQAISFCNGLVDCDSVILLPRHKEIIAELAKNSAVVPCEYGDAVSDYQKYRLAPNRYIDRAHWSITGKCNMQCRHCYMSAPQAKYGELSHETCMDIVRQLAEANIARVSLTGGEPLVRDDFLELVDALLAERIVITQIYTNGLMVTQTLLDELKRRGVKPEFSLSFDGVGWHDWLRGMEGAEEIAIDAIKLLRANGFEVGVESAFHAKSLKTLKQTMDLLAELGVSHWKTNPASDSGNWIAQNQSWKVTKEELYEAYLDFIPYYLEKGSPITVMLGGFFWCRKGKTEYRIPCKKYNGTEKMLNMTLCMSARTTMYIAADSTLLPCIPLTGLPIQDTMPKLTETPLSQALSDSTYLRRIDTRLCELLEANEKCAACEHRLYCGGGCRAGALMTDGEYLGHDEYTCYFFQGGFEEKIKERLEQIRVKPKADEQK